MRHMTFYRLLIAGALFLPGVAQAAITGLTPYPPTVTIDAVLNGPPRYNSAPIVVAKLHTP